MQVVDCIYMTKEYVENIKKNNYREYICGEYKEGRYAWILENVQVLDNPIKTKGHLDIWNYEDKCKISDSGIRRESNDKKYNI